MEGKKLEQTYIYRMTHINNIPHILKYGIVHKSSPNADPNYITIGDQSLIGHRTEKNINLNGKIIQLGNFTPFYFGKRMPMLYIIQNGFNSVSPVSPSSIVYMAIRLTSIINDESLEYYFTDGHAFNALSRFYDKDSIAKLPDIIDWQAINSLQWGKDIEDTDLKRRKEAEFLIKGDIPAKHIEAFACYDQSAEQHLLAMGIDKSIKIDPKIYY